MLEKECVTCGGKGHTYLECPRVSFTDIVAGALGTVNFLSSKTPQEVEQELEAIRQEEQNKHRQGEINYRIIPFGCPCCGAFGSIVTKDPEETFKVTFCNDCSKIFNEEEQLVEPIENPNIF